VERERGPFLKPNLLAEVKPKPSTRLVLCHTTITSLWVSPNENRLRERQREREGERERESEIRNKEEISGGEERERKGGEEEERERAVYWCAHLSPCRLFRCEHQDECRRRCAVCTFL
jgi:hypothetical protein